MCYTSFGVILSAVSVSRLVPAAPCPKSRFSSCKAFLFFLLHPFSCQGAHKSLQIRRFRTPQYSTAPRFLFYFINLHTLFRHNRRGGARRHEIEIVAPKEVPGTPAAIRLCFPGGREAGTASPSASPDLPEPGFDRR